MEYRNFFALLGGLALFLYGMHQMSEGLNAAAGEKMKQILERLTKNRFLGVGVGAAVTAVIQSSLSHHGHGRWLCEFRDDDSASGGLDYHGGKYRHHNHRSADCTGCGSRCAASGFWVVLILFAGKDRIRYTGEIVAGLESCLSAWI